MIILIAGDFCPQNRVSQQIDKGDYESVLGQVRGVIAKAEYSIVNFECPVTKGGEKPILKQGPNLQCSAKGIEAVKWAGFDCVTLANNHFRDYGDEGVKITIDACKDAGVDTVGGGKNLKEASAILYKIIGGKTLAVINCCEHEFSIATDNHGGANPLNPVQQYYAIKEAKEKADYVLVIVHGGHEHFQLPSTRMQETYRFFIDAGADAVVNHHQHCFSGYEFYNGRPIIYGLGNFCFDEGLKNDSIWHEGYIATIDFENDYSISLHPYIQCADEPIVRMLTNMDKFEIVIHRLNSIIVDNAQLELAQDEYYGKSAFSYQVLLSPFKSRFIKACQRRGWLPLFYTKKSMLQYYDYINCESHRDKMLFSLNKKLVED